MAQQVVDRGLLAHGVQRHSVTVKLRHLQLRKGRQILTHRIAQHQLPALRQLQHRQGGDGLGHRVDAEDRIQRHGRARLRVLQTERLMHNEAAMAGDQQHHTGNATQLSLVLQMLHCASQPCGVETGRGRVDEAQGSWTGSVNRHKDL